MAPAAGNTGQGCDYACSWQITTMLGGRDRVCDTCFHRQPESLVCAAWQLESVLVNVIRWDQEGCLLGQPKKR